jgi:hypothetical protein
MLHVGQEIEVRAIKRPRRADLVYPAICVSDDGDHIVLRAVRVLPCVCVGPTTFEPGDLFEEHYWRTRWYSVMRVHRPDGVLKGWYGNVASPAQVVGGMLSARDLELDLWVSSDGEAITRLDEDEFLSSGLTTNEPHLAEKALEAFAELEAIIRRGGLMSLLSDASGARIKRTL